MIFRYLSCSVNGNSWETSDDQLGDGLPEIDGRCLAGAVICHINYSCFVSVAIENARENESQSQSQENKRVSDPATTGNPREPAQELWCVCVSREVVRLAG